MWYGERAQEGLPPRSCKNLESRIYLAQRPSHEAAYAQRSWIYRNPRLNMTRIVTPRISLQSDNTSKNTMSNKQDDDKNLSSLFSLLLSVISIKCFQLTVLTYGIIHSLLHPSFFNWNSSCRYESICRNGCCKLLLALLRGCGRRRLLEGQRSWGGGFMLLVMVAVVVPARNYY